MNKKFDKEIIVYDGICVLCNFIIRWVIKNDKNHLFSISSLQSHFIKNNFPDINKIDSIAVIINDQKVLNKGKAIKHILKNLKKLIIIRFMISVIPIFLLNIFYDIIAKTRYKVFGIYESCPIIEVEKNKILY
jgi:predicted DCC family thiol-disulfide oxidoreductase YuxK